MKKFLSFALTLALCLGLALPAAAADNTRIPYAVEGGNIYFDATTGTIIPSGGLFRTNTNITAAVIPAEINGVAVTSIGQFAFVDCNKLTRVVIPDSVTDIGWMAFEGCVSLTSVTIPDSVTSISFGTFKDCAALTSVIIPNSVTSIEKSTFENCSSLSDVNIPNGVTRIYEKAFKGCTSLTSINIPNSVTRIDQEAFKDCTGLTSINVPDSVTGFGWFAFENCTGLTSVTLSSNKLEDAVSAFKNCTGLTSVTIPNNTVRIGYSVFSDCTNLASVIIPNSVTSIARGAFRACTDLKDVYYAGSEAQWKGITIGEENDILKTATIHYNSDNIPATPTPTGKTATPTNDALAVNGAAQTPTVYKIDGNNYFKIRDVAAMLSGTEKQFTVGYENGKVTATAGQPYQSTGAELTGAATANGNATASNDKILINGVETALTVYKINGNNYFKLRDLGRALDFYVGYTNARGVFIETDKGYTE